ncbi:MAG: ThuA domain-containing protein [Bacteroidales bacterium]|nr:ThuA domain-containing protein [Bacteroidales bacterium]
MGEYIKIIGGKYFHQPATVMGKEYQKSSYQHDLNISVEVLNPAHPVTKGLTDFTVFDEAYYDFYVEPEVTPLLKTSDENASTLSGWTKQYGKARVVTIQTGHDSHAFHHPNYRKLVEQSILWVFTGR